MVLENVKEMWTEKPKGNKGKGVNKDRFVSKMYVGCSIEAAIAHTRSILSISWGMLSD